MLLPRPASGELTPALLCVALAGGLAAQLVWPIATEFPPTLSPPPPRPRSPAAVPVPDYPALLAAPLFSPDRRSLGGSGGGVGGVATGDQRPILIGVASDRRSGTAVIRGGDGAAHVVRLGETWRGWRLVGIGVASAAFDGPGGRFTARIGAATSSASASAGPSTSQEGHP